MVDSLVISGEMKCQPQDYRAQSQYSRSFLDFEQFCNNEKSADPDDKDYRGTGEVAHSF